MPGPRLASDGLGLCGERLEVARGRARPPAEVVEVPGQALHDREQLAPLLEEPVDPLLGVRVAGPELGEAPGLLLGEHGEEQAKVYPAAFKR